MKPSDQKTPSMDELTAKFKTEGVLSYDDLISEGFCYHNVSSAKSERILLDRLNPTIVQVGQNFLKNHNGPENRAVGLARFVTMKMGNYLATPEAFDELLTRCLNDSRVAEVPISFLIGKSGLERHRALLFKYFADLTVKSPKDWSSADQPQQPIHCLLINKGSTIDCIVAIDGKNFKVYLGNENITDLSASVITSDPKYAVPKQPVTFAEQEFVPKRIAPLSVICLDSKYAVPQQPFAFNFKHLEALRKHVALNPKATKFAAHVEILNTGLQQIKNTTPDQKTAETFAEKMAGCCQIILEEGQRIIATVKCESTVGGNASVDIIKQVRMLYEKQFEPAKVAIEAILLRFAFMAKNPISSASASASPAPVPSLPQPSNANTVISLTPPRINGP